jgi:hypothetical protein
LISGDAGSGVYQLPEIVEIHGTQALYLEQFSAINSWLSVDETCNQFYIVEWSHGTKHGNIFNNFRPRALTLPIVAYNANALATQAHTLLNGTDKMVTSTYTIERTLSDPTVKAASKTLMAN